MRLFVESITDRLIPLGFRVPHAEREAEFGSDTEALFRAHWAACAAYNRMGDLERQPADGIRRQLRDHEKMARGLAIALIDAVLAPAVIHEKHDSLLRIVMPNRERLAHNEILAYGHRRVNSERWNGGVRRAALWRMAALSRLIIPDSERSDEALEQQVLDTVNETKDLRSRTEALATNPRKSAEEKKLLDRLKNRAAQITEEKIPVADRIVSVVLGDAKVGKDNAVRLRREYRKQVKKMDAEDREIWEPHRLGLDVELRAARDSD